MKFLKFCICIFSLFLFLSGTENTEKEKQILVQNTIQAIHDHQYTDALKLIRQAKSFAPEDPEIYRLEGQLLEILDNRSAALIAWKMCLKFAQSNQLIHEAKIHINHLNE